MDIDMARAKLRRAAIRRALYAAYPRPLGAGLIGQNLPLDLAASADELARAMAYLLDRQSVACAGAAAADGPALWRLTADGVDRVEEAMAGSDRPGEIVSVRSVRMLRLRCLQALSWGGPAPMGVPLISAALAEDTDLDLSEPSIKRALAYLSERRLAVPVHESLWRIAANGTDYLAGEGDRISGVARPTGW